MTFVTSPWSVKNKWSNIRNELQIYKNIIDSYYLCVTILKFDVFYLLKGVLCTKKQAPIIM